MHRLVLSSIALLLSACGRSPTSIGLLPEDLRCGAREADFFASTVLDYDPEAGGGAFPERDDVIDPAAALGPPDHTPTPPLGTVSIGDGGTLTLGFGRCALVTGPGPDLVVFEAGFDERVFVAVRPTAAALDALGPGVSPDPEGFVELAVPPDSQGGVDIDVGLPESTSTRLRFDAVRIRDVAGQGLATVQTPGADIDALGLTDVVELDD